MTGWALPTLYKTAHLEAYCLQFTVFDPRKYAVLCSSAICYAMLSFAVLCFIKCHDARRHETECCCILAHHSMAMPWPLSQKHDGPHDPKPLNPKRKAVRAPNFYHSLCKTAVVSRSSHGLRLLDMPQELHLVMRCSCMIRASQQLWDLPLTQYGGVEHCTVSESMVPSWAN